VAILERAMNEFVVQSENLSLFKLNEDELISGIESCDLWIGIFRGVGRQQRIIEKEKSR
jgi:hypothetical protein